MESRVESHAPQGVVTMNTKPSMFQAGLSNKFTKRHTANFQDTTLMAASAAKARAELKMERQANAIEKQQQKIEHEMKKIEAITEKLQRQQVREAKRLRNRLHYAATRIQRAYRAHVAHDTAMRSDAAMEIQRHWRGWRGREFAQAAVREQRSLLADCAAHVLTRSIRLYACRLTLCHEIQWRQYAATTIQCVVRQHQARRRLLVLRHCREEGMRRDRAAIAIQSHGRGFLTRLVYMDVLYLVCRIQSVVRGFLVRQRLRWLLSLDIRAIIQLQAHVRGFLARRRTLPLLESHRQRVAASRINEAAASIQPSQPRHRRPTRPQLSPQYGEERGNSASRPTETRSIRSETARSTTYALASMASAPSPLKSPQRMKRSYWLPSGTNTSAASVPSRHRLPRLSFARATPLSSLQSASSLSPRTCLMGSLDDAALRAVHAHRMTRAKLGKHRPPPRLAPLAGILEDTMRVLEDDNGGEQRAAEERREREEALKQRLLIRRAQEKKRLELEAALRHEHENELVERRQMEREEKLVRLWVKTTHRRHHEIKMRRQTVEQQHEERERIEMARDERLLRLHLKKAQRTAHDSVANASKRVPRRLANGPDDSEPESLHGPPRMRDRRDEDERERYHHYYTTKQHDRRSKSHEPSIAIPKQRTKPSGLALKRTRELRAVYGGGALPNQRVPENERSIAPNSDLQAQYESWNFHTDNMTAMHAELVEDGAEFDYGNDFDDVVEETKLTRLLC